MDLLEMNQNRGGQNEWIVSYIVNERAVNEDNVEYRVRWYGFDEDMDTWEKEQSIKHTKAFRKYKAQRQKKRGKRERQP